MSRNSSGWHFAIFLVSSLAIFCNGFQIVEKTEPSYEPTWESLDQRPLPSWYDHAKVGIFLHWGVYSVPTMGSEWFWKFWRGDRKREYVNYMKNNFKPGFTYQEFAHDFTAEHFNAIEWATLFEESGAKYVVLTSKHHDGYALWPSKYSFGWNSVDIGPHRDIIGELSNAIRSNTNLTFGLYHSLYEWFNPVYLNDKRSSFSKDNFITTKVIPEMKELIYNYKPEILWSDGDGEAEDLYWKSTEFIAWLYNESPVRETVVTNDRWGKHVSCKHGDFYTCDDRYNPGVLQKHKWENAMTIDKYSWGHRANARLEDFLTSAELIKELVSTVSCNGNILINVGPTKSGLIEPIFVERLRDMGKWLKVNGEAIYNSMPWMYQKDKKTRNVWYTMQRYSADDRCNIYAIVLDYPFESNSIDLYALGDMFDNSTTVTMLGLPDSLEWKGTSELMHINFPAKTKVDKMGLKLAWTLKINIPLKDFHSNSIN